MEEWGLKAKEQLRLYGLASVDEMVSEALSQYVLGEPGELAKEIIRELTEVSHAKKA